MGKNRKRLLVCLAVFFVIVLTGFLVAACSKGGDEYSFENARKPDSLVEPVVADEGVTIDGVANESFWADAGVLEFTEPQYDIGVKVRAYLGESGVYIYAERDDTSVYYSDEKQFFENDSMEFMIDPRPALSESLEELNKVGARVRPDMVQLRVAANGDYTTWIGRRIGDSDYQWAFFWLPCLTAAKVNGELNTPDAAQGFSVEVFVPYSVLLLDEKPSEIGLMPASVYAHSFMHSTRTWYAITGMNIDSPATYARLTDQGFTVDANNVECANVPDADAEKAVWQAQDAVKIYEADEANLNRTERATFKSYLGEDGVYVLAQVYDKVITRYNFVIWNNDGIEFYIDANNQGGTYEEGVKRNGFYRFAVDVDGKYQAEKGITGFVNMLPVYAAVKTAVKTETLPSETGPYGYTSLTTYEVFIPYETIGLSEKPAEVGMDYAVKTPNEMAFVADRHLNYTAVMEADSWLWLRNHYLLTPDTFFHVSEAGLMDADPFYGLEPVWREWSDIEQYAQSPDPNYYNYQACVTNEGIWVKAVQTVDTVKLALTGEEAANAAAESRDYLTHIDINIWNNNFGHGANAAGSNTYFILYPNTDLYCANNKNLTRTAYRVTINDRGDGVSGRYEIVYELYLGFDNTKTTPTYIDVKTYTPGFDGYTAGVNRTGTNSKGVTFYAHPTEKREATENGFIPEVTEGNFSYRAILDDSGFVAGYSIAKANDAVMPQTLEIPATFNGKPVTTILADGFKGCTQVETLIIGENVKTIGNGAFTDCTGLRSVDLGNVVTIENNAFNLTKNGAENYLTSITLPSTLRSIGQYIFLKRTALAEIVIQEGIEEIGAYAFRATSEGGEVNSGLQSIVFPASVKTIGRAALYGNTGLKEVTFLSESAMPIGDSTLGNCSALQTVTFHSATPPTVPANPDTGTNANVLFTGSTPANAGIKVPDGAVETYRAHPAFASRANYIYDSFMDSFIYTETSDGSGYAIAKGAGTMPETLQIPDMYNGKPVTEIAAGGFDGCSEIVSVILPGSVVTIRENAFRNCSGITSIDLGAVETIGANAFSLTSNGTPNALKSITLPASLRSIGSYVFQRRTALEEIIIEEGIEEIGASAFMDMSLGSDEACGVKKFTFPASVKTIGRAVLLGNTALEEIEILSETPISIGVKAFGDCPALRSITFAGATVPDIVRNTGESASITIFSGNNSAKATPADVLIKVPDGAAEAYRADSEFSARADYIYDANIELFAFTEITEEGGEVTGYSVAKAEGTNAMPNVLEIPATYNGKPVTAIAANGFAGCTTIRTLIIPDSVVTIGKGAFSNCTNLRSVDLGSVVTIENNAFNLTTNGAKNYLTSITLPSTLRSIGQYVFLKRTALAEIIIEEGIEEIGPYAFRATSEGGATDSGLQRIVFPASVKTIGRAALYANTGLKEVTFLSEDAMTIGDITLGNCSSLEKVTFRSAVPPTVPGNNGINVNVLMNGTTPDDVAIFVPADAVAAYKAHPAFSARADYIAADSEN